MLRDEMPLWPADKVERWPIDRVKAYPRNARTHTPEQISQIADSIRQFGWTMPALCDDDGTLIAGHARVAAARLLGVNEIPVMIARGWSHTQINAYRLADNQLALNAGWSDELLRIELADLKLEGFDLPLLGFSDLQLADLLTPRTDGLTDPDDVPEPPAEPVSKLGDVWLLGRHRLLCGDATSEVDVSLALGGVRPHLMVTDPPYGVDYDPEWRAEAGVNRNRGKMGHITNDSRIDWSDAWLLSPADVAYCWHDGRRASAVQASLEAAGYEIRCQIIWAKDRFALSRGNYHWQHEPCWYAVRNTAHWAGDRSQSTLWQIAAREDSGHGHGSQKPVECMRRPIENNSSPGQAVYDPFVGSGTSIIAAEMTGRSCHALEITPTYCDVSVLRWQAFSGQQATLEATDQTFAEVAESRSIQLVQENHG